MIEWSGKAKKRYVAVWMVKPRSLLELVICKEIYANTLGGVSRQAIEECSSLYLTLRLHRGRLLFLTVLLLYSPRRTDMSISSRLEAKSPDAYPAERRKLCGATYCIV